MTHSEASRTQRLESLGSRKCSALVASLTIALATTVLQACGNSPANDEPPANVETGQAEPPTQVVTAAEIPNVTLSPAFPKLAFHRPVFFAHAGDGTNRVYVVEQKGRIVSFENDDNVENTQVFLDISDRVKMGHNEEGLLSLVFHPDYKTNGRFFVYYSMHDPKRNMISEFARSGSDPNVADPQSEKRILELPQKWGNHNGSTLLFGADGYLYASVGDGGLANDPDGNGQNLDTLLAKIIRIDIDKTSDGKAYAIPADNPFVNQPGARPEVWAYGLRNVWRMSFDRTTGRLWAGDVGQNAWEEIDLIVKGGNYGWNIREGKHAFKRGEVEGELIEPVAEYSHRNGGLSVTGGYVYRGEQNSRLVGVYLYADYATKKIWGLRYDNSVVTGPREVFDGREGTFVSSFGEDARNELYVCGFDKIDGGKGRLFRVREW